MDNRISFDEIFKQNERRIHYQIHKMNIRDPHQDYFQEGLVAMWRAYESYQPDKGPMATYFNYMIRNRLIDRMRKENRHDDVQEQAIAEQKTQLTDGNHYRQMELANLQASEPVLPIENPDFWNRIKSQLTANQWKWVHYHIIQDMPYKDIAIQENTTIDAVKGWGRQVRKKRDDPQFQETIALIDSM